VILETSATWSLNIADDVQQKCGVGQLTSESVHIIYIQLEHAKMPCPKASQKRIKRDNMGKAIWSFFKITL